MTQNKNKEQEVILDGIEITIIIPSYNNGGYLKEAVESVINQTFSHWKLLIIDDCSTDPYTIEVLNGLSKMDNRITVYSSRINMGAGATRNIGLDHVTSEYVAFCDADDWWYPDKLEKQLSFMVSNEYTFTCTYYENCDEDLRAKSIVRQKSQQSYFDLISGCNIGTPGVIYRYASAKDIRFPITRRGEDWAMWLRLLKEFNTIYTFPAIAWKYRHVSGSTNSNKLRVISSVFNLYKDELGYGFLGASFLFCFVFIPRYCWRLIRTIRS